MLHIAIDQNDTIKVGEDIFITFKKKNGRKICLSIEAPKALPIRYIKGEKKDDTNGGTNISRRALPFTGG